ncbi:MAG: hypothetical protein ABJ118_02580 [Luteolibacter sp.]
MSDPSLSPQQRDFHCQHCNGRIVIPISLPSTTGPCPHCQGTITSPPPEEHPPAQSGQPSAYSALQAGQAPHQAPAPAPVPQQAPAPDQQAPAPQPQPVRSAGIPPRRDGAQPAAIPESDAVVAAAVAKKPRRSSGIIPAMAGLFLLILAGGAAVFYISNQMGSAIEPPNMAGSPEDKAIREANYIRVGWQKDAYDVLGKFIAARSVEDKLPYINRADALAEKMEMFYGGVDINDSDTPADSFSIQELSEEDRKRGLFMLVYDQPPQFALKDFFRPLAPLEVQYGIDEADLLLTTLARVSNFAMEPVRVHAFFKRTSEGLKLDWEVFAQTKYRKFQSYIELPDIGSPETFRVLIAEDVPDKGRGVVGARTYRIADPANPTDSARVNVKLDSEIGSALSIINWRGTKQGTPITKTATVELEWVGEPDSPTLEIKRFICWEFLGLGGNEPTSTAAAQ